MYKPIRRHIVFLGLLLGVLPSSQAQHMPANGFIDLFDGKSLNGWRGDTALWYVKDKSIVGEIKPGKELQRNSFLIWEGGTVSDFELVVEYRISAKGNSGFNYRSEELPDLPFALKGYQADLDGANRYTGQNYEERGRRILAFPGQQVKLPPVTGKVEDYAVKNVWTASQQLGWLGNPDSLKAKINKGDWNQLRIIAIGNRLKHYINGNLMSDVLDEDEQNRKMQGLLGFQVHVGPPMTIEVRHIWLKKLQETNLKQKQEQQ